MHSPRFPLELVAEVLSHLQDDMETIKRASLIARIWYEGSRLYLWKHIYLGPPKPAIRCKQMRKIIEARPVVAARAKRLTIVDDAKDHKSDYADGWLKRSHDILAILPLLVTLHEVSVKSRWYLNWTLASPQLRAALFDIFSNPHVREIDLVGMKYMPVTPFAHFCHLQSLSLERIEVDSREEDACFPISRTNKAANSPLGALKVLHIGEAGSAVEVLLKYITHLKGDPANTGVGVLRPHKLSVSAINFKGAEQPWSTILHSMCSHVTAYTIMLEWAQDFPEQLYQFHRFPRLTRLSFVASWRYMRQSLFDIPYTRRFGLQAYSRRRPSSGLRTFQLAVEFHDPGATPTGRIMDIILFEFLGSRALYWITEIDDILGGDVVDFPNLEEVEFTVILRSALSENDWGLVKETLETHFPRVKSKGVLNVRR
ncbi:hypothetical protein CC1G_04363 [Coprinopsis cinerea okayama7|uniref:F-box domain-containing protein n=1 Tax=Coprinopsis cinerea (strain Okayama-7 / 130 / ATCC MYA-4618 / FGSC 9003) TaxID=240176 RepID=A8N0R0_COPC7|nr:hypothetical protein CC1G_04363 [Coprinopsis cinerea okayama7\|eukprot:XP_001828392.1 hypothetical protein CC1G_04363 [Coprinopsis cinerea okayama7\